MQNADAFETLTLLDDEVHRRDMTVQDRGGPIMQWLQLRFDRDHHTILPRATAVRIAVVPQ